jgi:predicted O-methyltransferase YrrM
MIDIETLPSAWTGHRKFAEWIVSATNPNTIVDLGVDYGYSTFCLANPKIGTVYGIDTFEGDVHSGHHNDALTMVETVKEVNNYQNVVIIRGYFDDVAKFWNKPIDILHIDGLHTYEAATNDFNTWSKFLTDDAIILMHDVSSFPEVRQVFEEINMPKIMFTHSAGLGVLSKNSQIIENIKNVFVDLLY